jgi:membrane protein insertase Oxa1/YidC/SpoIIIJ
MLIQIPIFLGLYGALNSPEFMAESGHEKFLFVDKLYNSLQGHGGKPNDGMFTLQADDQFESGKTITVTFKDGKTQELPVKNTKEAVTVSPKPMIPGEPLNVQLNLAQLEATPDYLARIEQVNLPLINIKTKELESLTLKPVTSQQSGQIQLTQALNTTVAKTSFHMDVMILLVIYMVLSLAYQKLMQKSSPAASDPAQAMMMKMMPLMFTVMLFFIPIPAGVLIYLIITTLLMVVQTVWVMKAGNDGGNGNGAVTPLKPGKAVLDVRAK